MEDARVCVRKGYHVCTPAQVSLERPHKFTSTQIFFQQIHIVLHDPQLGESVYVEPKIGRADHGT